MQLLIKRNYLYESSGNWFVIEAKVFLLQIRLNEMPGPFVKSTGRSSCVGDTSFIFSNGKIWRN